MGPLPDQEAFGYASSLALANGNKAARIIVQRDD